MKNTKISSISILKRIQEEKDANKRGAVSISINLKLWEQFKVVCERIDEPASVVAEALIKSFIEESAK